MQVQCPSAASDFLPRDDVQCRLPFGVHTPSCAILCINICAHDKDPVVHVRVRWIMATQIYTACTISVKNNQLEVEDSGCLMERRRSTSSSWFGGKSSSLVKDLELDEGCDNSWTNGSGAGWKRNLKMYICALFATWRGKLHETAKVLVS